MKLSAIIEDVETKGFDITNCTVENGNCTLTFGEAKSKCICERTKEVESTTMEIKAICRGLVHKPEFFAAVRDWCNVEVAEKFISVGDQILIPSLYIPRTTCEGEDFDEIDLKDVVVTAVLVEPHRVVFNFDDILFRHDIDKKCSGKPFKETPLGVYLAKHFSEALEKYTGEVKVSLLTKENVFDENSKDFMPYFKPIKNRIKVLAFENDTWHWWLSNPYCGSAYYFCSVSGRGYAGHYYAHISRGVAPAFEITAESE